LAHVEEIRGLQSPPNLRALTVARRDLRDVYTALITERDLFEMEETTKLYRLLGYLSADQNLWDITISMLDSVLGFYSIEHKTLWVVTQREEVGLEDLSRKQQETLVHEIIHAIQDYHFDLGSTISAITFDLDATLAFTSVVEGDAVVHSNHSSQIHHLAAPVASTFLFLGTNSSHISDLPSPIIRELYFPYTTGAEWAHVVIQSRGVDALNAFLTDPPSATSMILHPELMDTDWIPESNSLGSFPEHDIQASLGPEWQMGLLGSLGEFQLQNYLLATDTPYYLNTEEFPRVERAIRAAEGWVGDRYALFEKGNEEQVLIVRVRFEDEKEAAEFTKEHYAATARHAEILAEENCILGTWENGRVVGLLEPLGREVLFAIGTSPKVVRAALEVLVKG